MATLGITYITGSVKTLAICCTIRYKSNFGERRFVEIWKFENHQIFNPGGIRQDFTKAT
jgi:hypothetical protein